MFHLREGHKLRVFEKRCEEDLIVRKEEEAEQ
jgi:hypothetical protein